jgi:hypothetical protein
MFVNMSTFKVLAIARDNEPLIDRAFAAYFRAGAREGASPDMPANDSCLCELDGKQYVVLSNIRGVLAVYRVRNNGILKGLKRWPKELEEA